MRGSPMVLIIAGLMLVLDFYVFQIVKFLSHSASGRTRTIIFTVYWALSILALIALALMPLFESVPQNVRSILFAVVVGLFLSKLLAAVFFLIDDIRRGFQWLASKLFFRNTEGEEVSVGDNISRSVFLSWLGLAVGGIVYGSFLNGFSNKYNYKVKKVPLSLANLPAGFKGLRVVQLSDIHCGSFNDPAAVAKGVQKILDLKPDLILFTGDLVNNTAEEMKDYASVFSQLKAPMGVYSVLGNHDYGDYVQWGSTKEKRSNLERLIKIQREMGWDVLLDEHRVLERGGDKMALIGIQNWSALKRFPRYGDLAKAHAGTEGLPFKILMSHDPTHWDAEIRTKFTDIDLTLSGHTHGMQFGLDNPWFRWSPVQYVYRQWMGLYTEGAQNLYVNRGYGFIGYPGRVGILPEITLFEFA